MANEFITTEHTQVMQGLIREIVNDPSTYLGSKYLPSESVPQSVIRNEIIEASGGLTNEHVIGTDPTYIRSFGTRVEEFAPPQYKEAIHYDEKKILHLRSLGQNDPSKRGIKQYIDNDFDRLKRRLEARIEYQRWQALFTGSFTWEGATFSYGIPSGNRTTPLGAVWSSDSINANNSANPLIDYRYWTNGGLAAFRKYKITKGVMNGNTARWMLDNSNTRAFIASLGANGAFSSGGFDLQKVIDFCIPGAPPVEIYNGWYQSESIDGNGKLVVGDAQYFIPDGYIFFEANLPDGDMVGKFEEGVHLSSGDMDNPGVGRFLVVDDNIASGTKGGPKNPYFDLVSGVYGGVNLKRSFDVLTAKVIS